MRATLLTAQRMADTIVREAEAKRDQMLSEAEVKRNTVLAEAEVIAKEKIARYEQELKTAEARMLQGQQELAKFIAVGRELCTKELALLDQLPQAAVLQTAAPVEERVEVVEPKVEEIEEKVLAAFAAEQVEEKTEEVVEEPVQDVIAEETAPVDDYPEGDPFAGSLESTRRINLSELKFGRNYTGEED